MSEAEILRPGAVALVTGASAGIGAAAAKALTARGARVICAARSEDRLKDLAKTLEGAHALPLDVTDADSVAGLLERLPKELREIDILVANAGSDIGGRQRFDQGQVGDWAKTVETNVTGVIRLCHAVIPGMLARKRGHVVTLGSTAGLRTFPKGSVYGATKFAVRAFTEALRADYGDTAIRISEILPGMTRTEFATARFHGDTERAKAFYDSFPGTLKPEDIADAIVYALSRPAHVTVAQMVVVPTREA